MSVAPAEPFLVRPTPARSGRPAAAPGRVRPVRPGPGTGPVAAPRRLRFTAPPTSATSASCRTAPAADRSTQLPPRPRPGRSGWRLTERGLAVVLVLAAALVAASVAVVALTAVRVTGESYHPARTASAPVVLAQG